VLLLAIDTSGKNGSIALAVATADQRGKEIDVIEVVPLSGGAFSAQLVPEIAALLKKHGFSKDDVSGFAVATGPGSFTGLRVGLAAVKALGEALQKPIAAISLLEAVASSGKARGHVLAALDAGRTDVYVGDYIFEEEEAKMLSERLLSRKDFIAEATGFNPTGFNSKAATIITPDSALAELLRASGTEVELISYPNAGLIARLGWDRLQRKQTVLPGELEANYIRRSDAEIFSKPNA
jgi:tRNA threonylcarbamoyladenosine biosynthesis protein TsaB